MSDIVISVDSSQVRSARGDVNDLGLTVVKQAQVIQRLERHYKLLDRSFNTGKLSAQQYAAGVQQIDNAIATVQSGQFALAAATNKTTSAIEAQSAALQRSHKNVNNFGMVSQQIGYQVGDFFVQVQSGTNALTAFGQQATQLAGLLPGLAGAIVGIGVSLGTALLNMSLRSRGLTISFQKMGEDLSRAFEPLRPMLDFIPKALGQATDAVNSFGQMVAQNFERVVAYTVAFATILATKVVAGFVLSGAAARTFFTLLRAGLISTGVGALVVAFGELLLAMNRLIKGAGSFSQAWKLVVDVFKEAFDRMGLLTEGFIGVLNGYWDQLTAGFYRAVNSMRGNWATLLDLLSLGVGALGMEDEAARLEQASLDARVAVAKIGVEIDNLEGGGANRVSWGLQKIGVAANSAWSSIDALKKALEAGDMGSVSIDPSSWLVPDDSDKKGKNGGESQLADLMREQKERAVLLTLYGKEKLLQQEIFAIKKQLGEEANRLTPQQIKDLAEINLLLSEQEEFQQKLLENYQQIANTLESSMEDAFMSIVSGTESAKDAFKKMAFSIIQELYRVLVVQRLVGSFNATTGVGTGIVGALMGGFAGGLVGGGGAATVGGMRLTGGMRASGGTMMAGKSYIVGEHGPELVVPRHSGSVVNANQTAGAMSGGGGITVQNNISVTGSDAAMVRAEVAKMIPQITNATKAAVIDAKQRGGQMAAAFR